MDTFPRKRIEAIRESPGLSGSTLTLLGTPDEPALAVIRYTHRQRRAVENVRFVLQQELEGWHVVPTDADSEYAASVAAPIREAQALVAGNQAAVLVRLVGYLARYKKQLIIGFVAATLITAVSLVPPYLAGYLIDEVVRPVQDGVLSVERGPFVAWLAVAAMAVVYLCAKRPRWCGCVTCPFWVSGSPVISEPSCTHICRSFRSRSTRERRPGA